MAAGSRHFSLYRRLWPWDHVPGVLILGEAGGWSARIDGADYRPSDRVVGLLSAADGRTWNRVNDYLATA